MSLTYVTQKLEDQTLDEGELGSQKECQVEDSGTESDDETDKEEGDDNESEEGDMNLDSGVSLNLRSGAERAHRGRSRQLPSMNRAVSGEQTSLPKLLGCLDDNDNHSSEEELEDIIGNSGKKKVYTGSSSIKTGSSITNTEKRKWSEVTSSGDEREEQGRSSTSQCVFRAGSGSSGDEEVSGLMLEGSTATTTTSYTPVQFCTSPPLDVYKPRKSQSPPPKLFHMSPGPPRQHSLHSGRSREGQRPSGAFLPRRLLRPVEYCSLPARQDSGDCHEDGGDPGEDPGHRSPNKRHRSTPKPQNIQRPCLDFEKMQQIKTKVVTSWRQGTELSLFCW